MTGIDIVTFTKSYKVLILNEFDYNVTGKILHKTQENKGLLTETNETVTISETTYDWAYEYTGSHLNAVTKASTRDFLYINDTLFGGRSAVWM